MNKIEKIDFENIDEDLGRRDGSKKNKRTFDPDTVPPEGVIGSFYRDASKNPEEKLIAEEEAKEIESSLRNKYDIPDWMGLEEISRRIKAGENIKDLEDAVKEAIELEKEAQSHEKNKFHRELALNSGELVDEGVSETTKEIEEVSEIIKENDEPKVRAALTSKKGDYYLDDDKESHVPKRKKFKRETILDKVK